MRKEPFLFAMAFLMDATFALSGLCAPLLAISLGADYDDLGAIGAAGAAAYALTCIPSGRLADRFGYRLLPAVASAGAAVVFLLYTAVSTVAHVLVLVVLSRLALAGFWPPTQAWLGKGKRGKHLLRTLGTFNVCWSLGIFVGPAVGGTLYGMNPVWPFVVASGAAAAVFVALMTAVPRDLEPAEVLDPEARTDPAARTFLLIAWTANFASFFAGGAVRALFPKLASDLGVESGLLGHMMALVGLAQLITFYVISRIHNWQFRLLPLTGIQILGALGLLTLAAGSSPAVFSLGLLSLGILSGTTFTSSVYYSLQAGGPGGRRTGMHEAILGSGHLLGPLLGGLAAEHLGARAPYQLAAAVILSAIVVQALLLRRTPARAMSPQAHD